MPRKKKAAKAVSKAPDRLTDITSNPFPPGLERPWPSPPAIPPRVHLFARFPHDQPAGSARLLSCGFVGLYAAKRWVEHLIGDDDFEWPNLHTIVTSGNLGISCTPPSNRMKENDLERVFNHEYSAQERFWVLPEQHKKRIEVFKREWPDKDIPALSKSAARAAARSVPKPEGELVSVSDLCMSLGIKPRDGRSALRKSQIEKPPYGWQFPKGSDELKQVENFLKQVAS